MRRNWAFRGLKFGLMAVMAGALFGFVVMSLWNWLMPSLFGLHVLSFWQALGVLILSRILLGGLRGRPYGAMHWRRRMMERMTPEERERFRGGMRNTCGGFGEKSSASP